MKISGKSIKEKKIISIKISQLGKNICMFTVNQKDQNVFMCEVLSKGKKRSKGT